MLALAIGGTHPFRHFALGTGRRRPVPDETIIVMRPGGDPVADASVTARIYAHSEMTW